MVAFRQIAQALTFSSAVLASAPQVADSPQGARYVAKFDKNIDGNVQFYAASNGTVQVDVDISGLPSTGGPFPYHIHAKRVDSTGNCSSTLAHFNPYGGKETNEKPQDKEVGDLSGRHGKIEGQSLKTTYYDSYLSLNEDNAAYFGNLSVVVHFANTSRIACANIRQISAGSSSNGTNGTSGTNGTTTPAADSGAAKVGAGVFVGAAAAAGLALLI